MNALYYSEVNAARSLSPMVIAYDGDFIPSLKVSRFGVKRVDIPEIKDDQALIKVLLSGRLFRYGQGITLALVLNYLRGL